MRQGKGRRNPLLFLPQLFNTLTNEAPAGTLGFYFYYALKVVLGYLITHK